MIRTGDYWTKAAKLARQRRRWGAVCSRIAARTRDRRRKIGNATSKAGCATCTAGPTCAIAADHAGQLCQRIAVFDAREGGKMYAPPEARIRSSTRAV